MPLLWLRSSQRGAMAFPWELEAPDAPAGHWAGRKAALGHQVPSTGKVMYAGVSYGCTERAAPITSWRLERG